MTASTFAPAFDVPALVAGMPDTEWTFALYASDMPTRRADHEPAQVIAWIVQGVERLGGEVAVWQRAKEFGKLLHTSEDAKRAAAWDRLFPKPRREDQAWSVARCLDRQVKAAGVVRRFPVVRVELPPAEFDEIDDYATWTVEVPARDLEMAERLRCEPQSSAGVGTARKAAA